MTREQIENAAVTMKESQNYHMSFEDAQDYINKCGFDIPWNDGDVFVDEREITRTVGNVLKWRINSVWHDTYERPDIGRVFLYIGKSLEDGETKFDTHCLYPNENWEDFVFGEAMEEWAYLDDLTPERKEETE